jgi:hypothetical protein
MEVTMEKGLRRALVLTVSTAVAVAWVGGIGSSATAMAAGPRTEANERLNRTINRAIHAEGPFFTPAEQAVVRRKCGYASGEWDGSQANMSNGEFICTNGRRVADAEMRELMEVAGERIGRRVSAAMESAEVQAAIARVADEATRDALARLGKRRWHRH